MALVMPKDSPTITAAEWQARVDPRFRHDSSDDRIEALLTELPGREVHRHRRYHRSRALPAPNLRADRRDHPLTDWNDQSGIFQHRDELAGLHETAIRALPTQ